MTTILAVDPSVSSTGAAIFTDGVLTAAGRVPTDVGHLAPARACAEVALAVVNWAQRHALGAHVVVGEWPQIYRAVKSKGDPNDLIALAGIDAALAMYYSSADIKSPTPAEWAGQLPKTVKRASRNGRVRAVTTKSPADNPRGRRILSRLSAAEARIFAAALAAGGTHDTVDAVGLGLWALGRLEPRRVITAGGAA